MYVYIFINTYIYIYTHNSGGSIRTRPFDPGSLRPKRLRETQRQDVALLLEAVGVGHLSSDGEIDSG